MRRAGIGLIASWFVLSQCATQLFALAINFQEPVDWSVGDLNSTYQKWEASEVPFKPRGMGTPPFEVNANPTISAAPEMDVLSPGNRASSGGFYSFGGDFGFFADIYNHGGTFGAGGPYGSGYGTRVIVQTASTFNDDPNEGGPGGIKTDTMEIVQLDGSAITGGDNASAIQALEISDPNALFDSEFGLVQVEEYLFEFWLPGYTGDFRVQADLTIHVSFQDLRVDSLIVEDVFDADFNENGFVEGGDFLTWQRDPNMNGGAAGLVAWEDQYLNPSLSTTVSTIPEPASALLLLAGTLGIVKLRWLQHKT